MAHTRLSQLPFEHLIAEMATFPFASQASFDIAPDEINLGVRRQPGNESASWRLWRAAENEMVAAWPGVSIDELVALRDKEWLSGPESTRFCIASHIIRLARERLTASGGVAMPRIDADLVPLAGATLSRHPAARNAWWWLTSSAPPDLFLAAYDAGQPTSARLLSPDRVEELSSDTRRMLSDKGFAETHQHFGLTPLFPHVWSALMGELANPRRTLESADFVSPGGVFREGRDLGTWLACAAIGRIVLVMYLQSVGSGVLTSQRMLREWQEDLWHRIRQGAGPSSAGLDSVVLVALHALIAESRSPPGEPLDRLLRAYRAVVRVYTTTERLPHQDPLGLDPLGGNELAHPDGERLGISPEAYLMRRGFRFFSGQPTAAGSAWFGRLFYQLVRIRCMYYRHVVLRPARPGLQFFRRFVARLGVARRGFDTGQLLRMALSGAGERLGITSFETRTSPQSTPRMNEALIKSVRNLRGSEAREASGGLEVGLVIHLTKNRDGAGDWDQGYPPAYGRHSYAEPGGKTNPCRYVEFARKVRAQARNLARTREVLLETDRLGEDSQRQISDVWCGLDVCSDELAVPSWVLAPYFRSVANSFDPSLPRLRKTVHAGEDYVHLLTGMRHLHESIVCFNLDEGDRIGHGLALGEDPTAWTRHAGRTPVGIEQRLLDLIWCCDFLTQPNPQGWDTPRSTSMALQRATAEMGRLAGALGISDSPQNAVRELRDVYQFLHNRFAAVGGILDDAIDVGEDFRRRMANRWSGLPRFLPEYLAGEQFYRTASRIIWVDATLDLDLLLAAQEKLRRIVACRGVAIEVNPSSNLLIGDMSDLKRHPLWRLRPPTPSPDDPPEVTICIGSDDPTTFATSLPTEYQRLRDVMVSSGLGDTMAMRWLNEVREAGMRARFTTFR